MSSLSLFSEMTPQRDIFGNFDLSKIFSYVVVCHDVSLVDKLIDKIANTYFLS